MKQRGFRSFVGILMTATFVLAFVLSFTFLPTAYAKEPKYILKMGTLAPDGVGWAAVYKEMGRGILKETKGEVALDWFYGGVMGDDEDVILKCRNDQLQGGGFSGAGVIQLCPEMSFMELPLLFDTSSNTTGNDEIAFKEVDHVIAHFRDRFEGWYNARGYHLLSVFEQDFDRIYSRRLAINNRQDLKTTRILTWFGALEDQSLKALGASPVPMNVPDVCANVRSGVTDAFISPYAWPVATQMYTFMKNIQKVNFRYSPMHVVITLKSWQKIPENLQKIITEYFLSHERESMEKIRSANGKCALAMEKFGVKRNSMSADELAAWKKAVEPLWLKFAENGTYPKALLTEVLQVLAEFRAKKP